MDERNKIMLLTLILLLHIVPFVSSKGDAITILQASRDILATFDTEKNMKQVDDYYFTDVKEKSIWYHALKEGHEMFGTELSLDNLRFIEKLIKGVASHYRTCVKTENCFAECFSHLTPLLANLEAGTVWDRTHGELSKEGRPKFGTLYLSAVALISHLSIISRNSFECLKNERTTKIKVKPIIKMLRHITVVLYDYVLGTVNWSVDQISPVIICDVTERFWKPFEKTCETRWHAVDDIGKRREEKRNVTNGNVTVVVEDVEGSRRRSVGIATPELIDKDMEFNDFSFVNVVEELGGVHGGLQKIKFRAQLHEYSHKRLLFEGYMESGLRPRGEVMSILAARALKVRSEFERKVRRKVEDFATKTFTAADKMVRMAIRKLSSPL